MGLFPQLNFPKYAFRLRCDDGAKKIWDPLRKLWLVLTPEEWVRRHAVQWLLEDRLVTPQLIVQEYPVCVQGQPQRADVVVFGSDGKPVLLVEVKEARVDLTAGVYAQAVRYNVVVGARYIMLTNGLRHLLYESGPDGVYVACDSFPDFRAV